MYIAVNNQTKLLNNGQCKMITSWLPGKVAWLKKNPNIYLIEYSALTLYLDTKYYLEEDILNITRVNLFCFVVYLK